MQSLSLLLSLTLLLVTLFYIVAVQEESDKAETVSIHPWQYCQGCKYTVELYAKVAADRLKQQKKAGGPAAMAGEEILGTLCEDPAFFNMQSYMRWSCMKVLGDNMNEFLAEFAGQFTATDLMNKADNFKRARRVSKPHVLMKVISVNCCTNGHCRSAVSIRRLVSRKTFNEPTQHLLNGSFLFLFPVPLWWALTVDSCRTKCNACRIIAEDIEMIELARRRNTTLSSHLGGSYCSDLGNRFSPYQWLGDVCEEMIEDRMGMPVVSICCSC
jgi:hypothetical protein